MDGEAPPRRWADETDDLAAAGGEQTNEVAAPSAEGDADGKRRRRSRWGPDSADAAAAPAAGDEQPGSSAGANK